MSKGEDAGREDLRKVIQSRFSISSTNSGWAKRRIGQETVAKAGHTAMGDRLDMGDDSIGGITGECNTAGREVYFRGRTMPPV